MVIIGPPDQSMSDVIREWNERYESPQFRISTAREFFMKFEEQYGAELPVFAGDMTPTWEDGAASTACETAMNRTTAARLAQTETIWSMLHKTDAFPDKAFKEAGKNVILFSEHTWGLLLVELTRILNLQKICGKGKKLMLISKLTVSNII